MNISTATRLTIEKLAKERTLSLVLLYGSCATGTENERSDIDIAVAFAGETPSQETIQSLYQDFSVIFSNNTKQRDIDLVVLKDADGLLLHEITSHALVLYGNRTRFDELRAYAVRRYIDEKPLRELEKKLINTYQKHLNTRYL